MPTAVPIDPQKLVEAAREFVGHQSGAGRPKPIWLRRAVSSAYYGLFHYICRETADHLLPNGTLEQRLRLARSFGHPDLNQACAWIAGRPGGANSNVQPIVDSLRSSPIAGVAASFCDLQEARHRADYDHLAPFSKATAIAHVDDAEKAISTLKNAQPSDREAFFSLLTIRARLRS